MLWFFNQIVVPILVIGVLIFIHELGHFLLAKLCKVGVVRFSIGFGPALLRFRRRETEYQIGAIPLGGFVRMVGDIPDMITGSQPTDQTVREEDEEEESESVEEEIPAELQEVIADRGRWFIEKNFWQRSAIVVAGPVFNYVLAIFLVFVAVLLYGEERIEEVPRVGNVSEGSPAENVGLQKGDLILSIDGQTIPSWDELVSTVHNGTGDQIRIVFEREGTRNEVSVRPQKKEFQTFTGEKQSAYFMGIGPSTVNHRGGLIHAVEFGALWTVDKTLLTYMGLWGMIAGHVSPKDLAGPLFILDAAGKQAEQGFDNLLYFTALLSVSLAVLNLLPIPILDGGHLMFFIIEALMGPISMRKKEFAQSIGMLLLISLMVFALHNDISRDPEEMRRAISWQEENSEKDKEENAKQPEMTQGDVSTQTAPGAELTHPSQ